jgi:hypothetical protein
MAEYTFPVLSSLNYCYQNCPTVSSIVGTVRPGFLGRRRAAQGRRIFKNSGRRIIKNSGRRIIKKFRAAHH